LFDIEDEQVLQGVSRELEKFTWWKEEMDLVPPAWRVEGLL
jgi:hypothetical protein